MKVTIIAALSRNGVIGRANSLPWHISEDLKRFKALTLGHRVVMGRRTFESIGRPLPGRDNVVVTRSQDFSATGCREARSIEEALAATGGDAEIFVIGGAAIYALALPLADRLQLTEIDAHIEGDAYFPEFDRSAWREISRERHALPPPSALCFDFVTYERPG